jgi:4-amino-4-deoxy-L-arabinose transferase-like glycosyltransferase
MLNPSSPIAENQPYASMRTRLVVSTIIVIGSLILLFTRLGHYPLWDDEAITAMTARAVLHTGDTSVRVDNHNLLVYRNGLLVRDFKDRYTPPLQFYLIAPFIGLLGDGSFACRLPFALCGVIAVAVILIWLIKANPPPLVWWAAAIILLTNASFFLFFRQCRYYGLAMMLSVVVAFLYCNRDGRTRWAIGLAVALSALLSAQYLNYAAVIGCLIVDYFLWGRKKHAFNIRQWMIVLITQLIVGGIVCSIWNPIALQGTDAYVSHNWVLDRIHLFWWNWRDMVASDFVIVPLLLLCPLLYLKKRSAWLLRAPAALFVYLGVISLAVATSLSQANNAEIRYLAPVLPLCVAISTLAVWGLLSLKPIARNLILILVGMTLLIEPTDKGPQPATALLYYHELAVPQQESYTPVIDWINANVPTNASIYVQPGFKTYPLMLRAPKAIYAWQLTDPPRKDFVGLPDIHFHSRTAPDFMIQFGTTFESQDLQKSFKTMTARGIHYKLIATLHYIWKDLYRPERIWRSFTTMQPGTGEEIYIYQKQ